MSLIVFDVETKNTFNDVGSSDPADLDISVVSVYEETGKKIYSFLEEDFDKMWPIFEKCSAIVGYNSDHFDIPLLKKYDKFNSIQEKKSIDIMRAIKESFGKRVKLDTVANATLGKNKIGNGMDAIKWWNSGEIEKIKKYCEEDVLITKDVFLYALKNKKLFIFDLNNNKIEIKINTENWEKLIEEEQAPTQSLF